MGRVSEDDGHQIGYKALPRGVPVHTADGVQLGTVYRVQDNAREHIFDGIVVRLARAACSWTRPRSPASPSSA